MRERVREKRRETKRENSHGSNRRGISTKPKQTNKLQMKKSKKIIHNSREKTR
jgi:hypothetical protein